MDAELKAAIDANVGIVKEMQGKVSALEEAQEKGEGGIAELKQTIDALATASEGLEERIQEIGLKLARTGPTQDEKEAEKQEAIKAHKEAFKYAFYKGGTKETCSTRELEEIALKAAEASSPEEAKLMRVESNPDGGFLVPTDTTGRIEQFIFETSPIRQDATVRTVTSSELTGIVDNDEIDAGWVGETEIRDQSSTPQLGEYSIPVHEIYAFPFATQKMIDDSSVDPEAWLFEKTASKFVRKENQAAVLGDGVKKPRGFLSYDAPTVVDVNTDFEQGKIVQIETETASVLDFDDLMNLEGALKMAYRMNAKWFLNRSTLTSIKKLKDNDGQYLWQPAMIDGTPANILGYSYSLYEDMPKVADGALPIAFGDMRATYQIIDRIGIRVLRDPYKVHGRVGFYTTKRMGGAVTNFDSLKIGKIKTP